VGFCSGRHGENGIPLLHWGKREGRKKSNEKDDGKMKIQTLGSFKKTRLQKKKPENHLSKGKKNSTFKEKHEKKRKKDGGEKRGPLGMGRELHHLKTEV